MNARRRLIVNADDLGLSAGVNGAVFRAHECGIVTSASLMVRAPMAAAAAEQTRRHRHLSVGLHIDLGEWAFRGGQWVELYRVAALTDGPAVEAEVARQLTAFRTLVGAAPTHLDSHQHLHRKEPVRQVVTALAHRLGVPVRHFTPGVTYCGDFYGQDGEGRPYPELVTPQALIALCARIDAGVTELGCHPGDGEPLNTMYVAERRTEAVTLCDPNVRDVLAALGIELISFRDVRTHAEGMRQGQSTP